ncbi:hypothetical protein KCP76_03550 [Salmonella enterica subsp. enterica serovar Weltevreden]|nr:hypothetical protein KCP76_03550 [Salmonella enterica subsp. enterica serovar Weltevreden]
MGNQLTLARGQIRAAVIDRSTKTQRRHVALKPASRLVAAISTSVCRCCLAANSDIFGNIVAK